jgi:hypothetical protein
MKFALSRRRAKHRRKKKEKKKKESTLYLKGRRRRQHEWMLEWRVLSTNDVRDVLPLPG